MMRSVLFSICVLTSAASGATLAYIDANNHLVYHAEGAKPRVVDQRGYEPSLRPDGKQLVYMRQVSDRGPNYIVLFDAGTGRSQDLASGYVGQPLWSPDGTRIAFLRYGDKRQVWMMDPAQPANAAVLSDREVKTLASWTPDSAAVIAYDYDNVYWMGRDGKTLRVLSGDVLYGKQLDWMSGNQLRIHPKDPELLLVSAYYLESPKGAPRDEMDLTPTVMLFDVKSGKRTPVLANSNWGMDGRWSPDGAWVYFSRGEGRNRSGIWRVHADGSGLERVVSGRQPDVAR